MRPYDPDALDRRDPRVIAALLPVMELIARRYLRLAARGLEHLPRGPAVLVANHNGGIMGPDLFCTMALLWRTLGPAFPLHALAHDFAMKQLTPFGWLLQRLGAVSASPANALRVLAAGGQVLVYPGGDLDAYRTTRRRDEVVLLPRAGFVRVARAAGVPIVPIVAQGAHRSAYIFSEGRALAQLMRLPEWGRLERFPLALALPWGFAPGPWLPYLPLPFPVRVAVLPPLSPPAEEAPLYTAMRVQDLMQRTLDELRAEGARG